VDPLADDTVSGWRPTNMPVPRTGDARKQSLLQGTLSELGRIRVRCNMRHWIHQVRQVLTTLSRNHAGTFEQEPLRDPDTCLTLPTPADSPASRSRRGTKLGRCYWRSVWPNSAITRRRCGWIR